MLTLTVDPQHWPNPYEAAHRLIESWRLIRQQAKRENKADKIEFLAVLELTKRGAPHLHILMRSPYIDQAWISREMHRHMRSPICYINQIKSQRHAARYVAKYVAKGPARIGTCKRFFRSRGYCNRADIFKRERDPSFQWNVIDLNPTEALQAFQICDWDLSIETESMACCTRREHSRWPIAARPPPWQRRKDSS